MNSGPCWSHCCPRGKAGASAEWTRRQLINGIRFPTRTGVPWRDVAERYGSWSRVCDLSGPHRLRDEREAAFRWWEENDRPWLRALRAHARGRVVRARTSSVRGCSDGGDAPRERAAVETSVGARRGSSAAVASGLPAGRPSWMTRMSRRSGPRWNEAPRRTGSRPTCGPWSGPEWWLSG
nr:transposase [Streptomyces roseoverticillatus]